MKVTNNRSNSATFFYQWKNETQNVKFQGFESKVLDMFTHIDQILSRQFIVNRTTSGTGETASNFVMATTPGFANNRMVVDNGLVENQTKGFWEIEI